MAREPTEPGSVRDVVQRIGIPRETQQRAEAHVALAERYPMLRAPAWLRCIPDYSPRRSGSAGVASPKEVKVEAIHRRANVRSFKR